MPSRPSPLSTPARSDAALIAGRRRANARALRRRLGLWRGLGRSNRLFPRKLVVTKEGKWIIGIALLLGFGAVNTGNNLLYLVLSLLISIITISGILSELSLRDVALERAYPKELEVGQTALLRVLVRNEKPRGAFSMDVSEVVDGDGLLLRPGFVLHLAGGEVGQCFQVALPRRRGPLRTSGLRVSTTYPFGFASKSRIFDRPARFMVLPEIAEVDIEQIGAGARGDQERSPKIGHGSEFRGLREARAGDALRDIHWKVSARRDRLIAREWEAEAARVAAVRFAHLAPGGDARPEALDPACATVAGLCQALLAAGLSVSLQTLSGHVPAAPELDGSGGQLRQIRRHLAGVLPADHPPPPEWPLDDVDWLLALRRAEQVSTSLQQGVPLRFAPAPVSGRQEGWLVRFASRVDVALEPAAADVEVLLDDVGQILSIERRADSDVAGAA